MKITIITAVKNNKDFIENCIQSVLSQTYKDIEYIIVDGHSTDGTLDIIKKYRNRIADLIIQENDGIYEALNTGIRSASGEIIGILHADDVYANENIIGKIVAIFEKYKVDSLYGDLLYVSRENLSNIIRYWRAGDFEINKIKFGWMVPHPTFFVKKIIYNRLGSFNENFRISADYELILRFLYKSRVTCYYLHEVLVKMRYGGLSNKNLWQLIRKSYEDYIAVKLFGLGFTTIILKNLVKIQQFFNSSRKGDI
jgi:glycosyltransferase